MAFSRTVARLDNIALPHTVALPETEERLWVAEEGVFGNNLRYCPREKFGFRFFH